MLPEHQYKITNHFLNLMRDDSHKGGSFEELPERECVVGYIDEIWYDEEDEYEKAGIIVPVSYIYPDDFDYTVEELPEQLDVVGYYPDSDTGIC